MKRKRTFLGILAKSLAWTGKQISNLGIFVMKLGSRVYDIEIAKLDKKILKNKEKLKLLRGEVDV